MKSLKGSGILKGGVEIDPRIELVEIIYRLSNVDWYRKEVAPERLGITPSCYEYLRNVDEYFAKYKNLEAVRLVKQMVQKRLVYDAIPTFALHLNPNTFKKQRDWTDDLTRRGLIVKELDRFLEAVREFAEKSDFLGFYESHRQYYDKIIEHFNNNNPPMKELIEFEENFFGEKIRKWGIILQLTFAYHSFAVYFQSAEGKEVYSILGIGGFEKGVPKFCSAFAHEFAHSFVNPAVDKHYDTLFRKYQILYEPVKEKMSKIAYSHWATMLNETLVRAFVIYWINRRLGESEAKRAIAREKERGFYFIDKIYNAYLNDYLPNRDKYKTFEDFLPEIAKALSSILKGSESPEKVR